MYRNQLGSLLVVLCASASFAADKPRVVVVPFVSGEGATDGAAQKFTGLVNEELKTRDDQVHWVAPPLGGKAESKAAPGGANSKKGGPSAEAQASISNGRKALEDLRFDDAIKDLKKGIELMLADPSTADYPAVLEGYISLGVAAFRMGEDKEAQSALFNLARLDPNYQLPPGYPPVFAREFEKARKKVDKQPKGSISVDGPPGATAFVDGRDLGMVPVLEENLAPGTHYVKVEGAKGERYGEKVELKSGTAKVKAAFKGGGGAQVAEAPSAGVSDPRINPNLDDGIQSRMGPYTKAAGADFALVGVVYRTGDRVLTIGAALYSAKKNGFVALPAISFDDEVLTANVEAYKLCDALGDKMESFGNPAALPLNLITKTAVQKGAGSSGSSKSSDEIAAITPGRKAVRPKDAEKTELTPEVRAIEGGNRYVDPAQPVDEPPPGEVTSSSGGVPKWVWAVVGVGLAAGAGVGGFFVYREVSRPVTGSVTATW